jgi:hypothetical protein
MTVHISAADWKKAAKERYGDNPLLWRFRCPSCGHVASVGDWKSAGANEGAIAFSCVGGWTGGRDAFGKEGAGPCNYAGGGLFRISPILVTDEDEHEHLVFDFADKPLAVPR